MGLTRPGIFQNCGVQRPTGFWKVQSNKFCSAHGRIHRGRALGLPPPPKRPKMAQSRHISRCNKKTRQHLFRIAWFLSFLSRNEAKFGDFRNRGTLKSGPSKAKIFAFLAPPMFLLAIRIKLSTKSPWTSTISTFNFRIAAEIVVLYLSFSDLGLRYFETHEPPLLRPSPAPSVTLRHPPSLLCTLRPSPEPSVHSLHPSSLSGSLCPSPAPSIPLRRPPSFFGTLRPSPALYVTLRPSTAFSVPPDTLRPSPTPSVPLRHPPSLAGTL